MPVTNQSNRLSLSARLILGSVSVIVATTLAAGLPAYWLVRTELQQQAWARVADDKRVTFALIEAEGARLIQLAAHAAQRPSLQKLVQEGNLVALNDYLQIFRTGVELDLLIVSDASGQRLSDSEIAELSFGSLNESNATFDVVLGLVPELVLLASHPIPGNPTDAYHVTVGEILDDRFVQQLAVKTGIEISILINGNRVATSLDGEPLNIHSSTAEIVSTSGKSSTVEQTLHGGQYYTDLIPIRDTQNEVVALVEVALPVNELLLTNQRALLTLFFSTFFVAALGSLLSGIYARRMTAPLSQLANAALNISQGYYTTPVPIPEKPYEIAALAAAFEASRANTQCFLEDLLQTKAWSETLIQSVMEGIVTVDQGGRITLFSHGAERITGWKSDAVLNEPINHIFKLADGRGEFLDQMPLDEGKRQISIFTHDGDETTLFVSSTRAVPPDGESEQTVLVLRDITEKEAAQLLRTYFLANISHEFRTPLSALNASVELLLVEIEDLSRAEIVELLNSIHFSVSGLQTLIDNLLESSSIEAGHFRINRRPTEVNAVIAKAIRVMTPLLDRRQQSLSLREPNRLPLINVDPTRLTQVLVNLLSNASKYSNIGETIDLCLQQINAEFLRFEVSDRGPGVPPDERSVLFRRFVRLGGHEKTQYGVGLGLSVVKTIVEEHGGKVGIDGRPGGGSIFWFTIPIEEDPT